MRSGKDTPNAVNPVSVAILAGGQSRRMGTDKSFVLLDGKPLIDHVIERVSALSSGIILITNSPDRYARYDLPAYSDIIPNCGALGGLHSALHHCPTEYVVCVACDMPFLNPNLLQHLVDLRDGYQAVAPRIAGKIEGLHAVYNRSCLNVIEQQINARKLRLSDMYAHLHALLLSEAQIRALDPDLRSFVNVNTPDSLSQVQRGSSILSA
jgi:molybdopterin-guanine dinucleotide biosynthesis protein A